MPRLSSLEHWPTGLRADTDTDTECTTTLAMATSISDLQSYDQTLGERGQALQSIPVVPDLIVPVPDDGQHARVLLANRIECASREIERVLGGTTRASVL